MINKFLSYLYELHWRFVRLEENIQCALSLVFITVSFIVFGFILWLFLDHMGLEPGFALLGSILSLMLNFFLTSNYIQEKFKRFESKKVKFGKKVDKKYIELAQLCYSNARQTKDIKELASFVFPKLSELHGKKEVEEKIYNCFRSVVAKDNLDTVHYFIIDLNVKVSEEYRKNLKEKYPELEKLFNLNDLNHELNSELKVNTVQKSSKPMKI